MSQSVVSALAEGSCFSGRAARTWASPARTASTLIAASMATCSQVAPFHAPFYYASSSYARRSIWFMAGPPDALAFRG